MISSRFSKKGDQIPETGLNNSESNETPKTDNNMSPHSQLVQRGVYLANSQQCNRNAPPYGSNNNGVDVAKRSQEVRDQINGQYRERGVDVGQTVGVAQQYIGNDNYATSKQYYQDNAVNRATSRQTVLDNETPNRFREMEQQNAARRYEQATGNVSRNVRRFANTPGDMPSTSGTYFEE